MKKVLRGNRILRVEDDQVESYMLNGYAEIDENGKVVNEIKKDDAKALKKENKTLQADIDALKLENETLKEQIVTLQPAQ